MEFFFIKKRWKSSSRTIQRLDKITCASRMSEQQDKKCQKPWMEAWIWMSEASTPPGETRPGHERDWWRSLGGGDTWARERSRRGTTWRVGERPPRTTPSRTRHEGRGCLQEDGSRKLLIRLSEILNCFICFTILHTWR